MKRVAIFYNPYSPESMRLSSQLGDWLRAHYIEVWRGTTGEARGESESIDCSDLIIALGGDGTVLRAARLSINCGVPVLPVALGHLNFMAELMPEQLYDGLEKLLGGGGWYDERAMIAATIHRSDPRTPPTDMLALNEVLVGHSDINRVVTVDVEIYDAHLTTYHADGVIVATATGSTAYALSAGGPIIDPRSKALALVPVAAHLTNIPSLVLDDDAEVTLTLRGRNPAAFTADGRDQIALSEGDRVEVRRAGQTCIFARVFPQSTFYARMTQRLRRD